MLVYRNYSEITSETYN